MVHLRLSEAEAKRLGLSADGKPALPTARKPRRSRLGDYLSRCRDCQEEFRSAAEEDRHVERTRHARYELPLADEGGDQGQQGA